MRNLCLGKKLAESIVREKLAACVNRVPGMHFIVLSCMFPALVMGGWKINQEDGLPNQESFFRQVQIVCLNENAELKFPGRHCFMHSIYLKITIILHIWIITVSQTFLRLQVFLKCELMILVSAFSRQKMDVENWSFRQFWSYDLYIHLYFKVLDACFWIYPVISVSSGSILASYYSTPQSPSPPKEKKKWLLLLIYISWIVSWFWWCFQWILLCEIGIKLTT